MRFLLLLPLPAAGVLARALLRLRRPAVNNPRAFLARGTAGSPRVVCVGASTVRGRTAADADIGYLPLNERLRELLRAHPGARREPADAAVVRAILLRLGLGAGPDWIAALNGYAIHTDGLHPAGRIADFVLR